MKTFLYNIGYFLDEAIKTIRFNLLSNLFSLIGTGLILFLLGMVYAGWSMSDQIVDRLSKEAEISVYFDTQIRENNAKELLNNIKDLDGVWSADFIDEIEAHQRMEKMLGEESGILALFDENPFEAFIEVRIELDQMDTVIDALNQMKGVDYLRDNRDVLEKMRDITNGIKIFGFLIILAVGITTIVIISHMIRQGIYQNREQIHTLKLLGAPNSFINFPFVLVGLLLTLCGGGLAIILIHFIIRGGYEGMKGSLPFLPLPSLNNLLFEIRSMLLVISIVLGLLGSVFGLSSVRKGDRS